MLSINKLSYKSFTAKFNINERINIRSHRNALNINWLFSTVLNDINMGFTRLGDIAATFPHPNNGIYHK
jgi:hypothetical protein